MEGATGRDKRKYERVNVTSSKHFADISEGGVFIKTDNPRRLGSKLHLDIKLEGFDEHIRTLARVIRVIHKAGATKKRPAGMALEFLDLPEETKIQLQSLIKKLRQQD